MTSIALVGSHGGFSGDRFHPHDSSVVLREAGDAESHELAWSFVHSSVGAGLVVALENLAHGLHFRDRDLDGVRIWTALNGQSRQASGGVIKVYRPLPFEYLYDVLSPTVVVEAEFVKRQDPEAMEAFRGPFDAWYAVAAAGGFADDEFRPSGEVAISIENELQITSVGLQVVYADAQVGESGFNVLTNMLTHFHSSLTQLRQVEIA